MDEFDSGGKYAHMVVVAEETLARLEETLESDRAEIEILENRVESQKQKLRYAKSEYKRWKEEYR
jgi:multidrug resistance efflux pump